MKGNRKRNTFISLLVIRSQGNALQLKTVGIAKK